MNSSNLSNQSTPKSPSTETPNLLLRLGTVPFLLTVVAGKLVMTVLEEIGQTSEEVFRGDRLPILPFPEPSESDSDLP